MTDAPGVGVDDSVHLLLHVKAEADGGADGPTALRSALAVTGRPIVLTSLALIAGFSVLSLSRFTPVAYFGLLVALAMVATTVGALLVLPTALLLRVRTPSRAA